MIQPSSKNQYIQNVTNAKLDVSGTGSLETIYKVPLNEVSSSGEN